MQKKKYYERQSKSSRPNQENDLEPWHISSLVF